MDGLNGALASSEPGTVEELEAEAIFLRQLLDGIKEADGMKAVRDRLVPIRAMLREGVEMWPQYDVRRGQIALTAVEQAVDAARERLRPRRRFKFNNARTAVAGHSARTGGGGGDGVERETDAVNLTSVPDGAARDADAYVPAELFIRVDDNDHATADSATVDVHRRAIVLRGDGQRRRLTLGDGALSVRIIGLKQCVVSCGLIDGPLWLDDCSRCVVRVHRCRQLRMHRLNGCKVLVNVDTRPILEACVDVAVGGSGVDGEGRWRELVDMSWLREGPSDNWREAVDADDDDAWALGDA